MPALFGVGSLIFCVNYWFIVPKAERRVVVTPLRLSLGSNSPPYLSVFHQLALDIFSAAAFKANPRYRIISSADYIQNFRISLYAFPGAAVTEPTNWAEKRIEVCHLTVWGPRVPSQGVRRTVQPLKPSRETTWRVFLLLDVCRLWGPCLVGVSRSRSQP